MSGAGLVAVAMPFLLVLAAMLLILRRHLGRVWHRWQREIERADYLEFLRLTEWIGDLKGRPASTAALSRNRNGVVTVVPPRELGGRLGAKHRRVD